MTIIFAAPSAGLIENLLATADATVLPDNVKPTCNCFNMAFVCENMLTHPRLRHEERLVRQRCVSEAGAGNDVGEETPIEGAGHFGGAKYASPVMSVPDRTAQAANKRTSYA